MDRDVATQAVLQHPYDQRFVSRSILAQPDGTVLDMFAGTATTGLAALELGRRFEEAIRARIAGYRKIAQYRAAMDADRDAAMIGPWISETQAKRGAAQWGSARRTARQDGPGCHSGHCWR